MASEFQPQPRPQPQQQQQQRLGPSPPSFPDQSQASQEPAWKEVAFKIDSKDVKAAQKIANALRYTSTDQEKIRTYPVLGLTLSSIVQLGKQFYDVRKSFHNAAPEMADKVGMTDIYRDVALHRHLQRVAAAADSTVPLFNFGNGQKLPCFFSASVLQQIAKGGPKQYEQELREVLRGVAEQKQICFTSRDEAESLFFSGLESYLVTRIAGGRWLAQQRARRSQAIVRAHSRERGQIGWTGLMRQGVSAVRKEGQIWDVFTQGAGLVIYWTNEYGLRIPAEYIGGKTEPPKPLKVFLRIGNGFIGADAGPNHTPLWYEARICVPAVIPKFETTMF